MALSVYFLCHAKGCNGASHTSPFVVLYVAVGLFRVRLDLS